MNFKFRYIFLLLTLILFSCVNDSIDAPDEDSSIKGDEVEYRYLSVNLIPTTSSDTRADGDFAVGSKEENKVNSIRFYFFDQNMQAVAVKANRDTYYEVLPEDISNNYDSGNEGNDKNIESNLNAVLVLESPKGDDTSSPYYIAAVINPTENVPVLEEGDPVTKLQDALDASAATNGFLMSSTVYKAKKKIYNETATDKAVDDTEYSEIIAQLIHNKIYGSRTEALLNPAQVYVERVLAKVSAELNITIVDNKSVEKITINKENESFVIYKLDKTISEGDQEESIYARFLGWNVTAARKTSRLVKKINTRWPDKFDGWSNDMSWNDAVNFRSFWAINPSKTDLSTDYSDYSFDDFNSASSVGFDPEGVNYTYLQENAGKAEVGTQSDVANSKVIVAAQLTDATGEPLELIQWGGTTYKYSEDFLDMLASYTKIYKAVEEKGVIKGWRSITKDDIKFQAPSPSNPDDAYSEDATPRYKLSVVMNDPDGKYAIYKSGSGESLVVDAGEDKNGYSASDNIIESALSTIGDLRYWNNGYMYYWVDIRHFGGDIADTTPEAEPGSTVDGIGKYGVVRNHWYQFTFTSVAGLGVPVSNPKQTIYPEIPEDPDESYLAAEIRILSWRRINQGDIVLGK